MLLSAMLSLILFLSTWMCIRLWTCLYVYLVHPATESPRSLHPHIPMGLPSIISLRVRPALLTHNVLLCCVSSAALWSYAGDSLIPPGPPELPDLATLNSRLVPAVAVDVARKTYRFAHMDLV